MRQAMVESRMRPRCASQCVCYPPGVPHATDGLWATSGPSLHRVASAEAQHTHDGQHTHDTHAPQLRDCHVLFLLQHTPVAEHGIVILPALLLAANRYLLYPHCSRSKLPVCLPGACSSCIASIPYASLCMLSMPHDQAQESVDVQVCPLPRTCSWPSSVYR